MTLHDNHTTSSPSLDADLAAKLRAATRSTHERLDAAIMAARPFDNLANYARFLMLQHAFHRDVSPLYADPALAARIPGLAGLSRLAAVTQDAACLGVELPQYDSPPAAAGLALPEALGWLYVVEGSNLGAAFLFKAALRMGLSAVHGASHLAEAPEGRAAHWRRFREALNAAGLSPAEETRATEGAHAAFIRVRNLVSQYLPPSV